MSAATQKPNKTKDTMVGFVIGGLAACGAVTFTNPWEVSCRDILEAIETETNDIRM